MKPLEIVIAVAVGLILLIATLLIFGKAKVRITCRPKLKVVLSVLGIRFTLVSDKDKKDHPKKDLSRCHNPDRVLKKELRRRKRAAKKAFKKRLKAAKKSAKRAEKKQVQAAQQPSPNLKENLEMITELLKHLYAEAKGKLGIHIRKMHIFVGTQDAAQTAIYYGVILQTAAYLLRWIDSHVPSVHRDSGQVDIHPDYVSGKCHAEIDIVCSIYISHAIKIALKMLTAYRSEKAKALKKAKRRIKKETAASKS